MDEKILNALDRQFKERYYTPKQLQYSSNVGILLSPYDHAKMISVKENDEDEKYVIRLPLSTFDHKAVFYSKGHDLSSLLETYASFEIESNIDKDGIENSMTVSRIYSEIEGTLNIESVPTTRRRLIELLEEGRPSENRDDTIIKNMKEAIDFVLTKPSFDEGNLHRLYEILSKGCLDQDDALRSGELYRYDEVDIDKDHCCPHERISECMDSLFEYVNSTISNGSRIERMLLPHIAHYYLIYVHPYFDYNGRTARMVSYWINLLCGDDSFLPIVSEAINQTKKEYYRAISLSRETHNDLTYFLKYVMGVAIDYALTYANAEDISKSLRHEGISITESDLTYVRRILITYDGPFTYLDFLTHVGASMSKQGALKILNRLVGYGILKTSLSKSKAKLFDVDGGSIRYTTRHFGYSLYKPDID